MPPFDPDQYLATKQAAPAFDPDAYLAQAQDVSRETQAPQMQGPEPFDVLPISESPSGELSFDPSAGIIGGLGRMAKGAFTAPGEVWSGELDPTSPEGMRRATEFAALATPLSAASRAGVGFAGVPKALPKRDFKTVPPKSPTRAELKEATTAGYGEAREMGAEYTPQAMAKWADDTANALSAEGQIANNYPKVHGLLNQLKNPPKEAKSVTLETVDAIYKELGRLGGDIAEGPVASIAQRSLDDFHAALGPEALVAGTASPERAAMLLREGRGNAAAGFRSDRITGLEKTAARRTAATASGRNTDNAIRQRLASLIESTKGSRGLTKAEEDAIDDIIFGTPTKETARYFGNLLGGGGGLGQMLTTFGPAAMVGGSGAGIGPTVAAMVPGAIGAASKTVANRMTMKELKSLDDMMRARSPLGEQSMAPQQVYAPSIAPETMAKALGARAMGQPAMQNGQMNRNRMIRAVGAPPGPGGYY